ncbi:MULTISPECIES: glycosyltransferase family 2 protein [Micrococcales]|uniref:glycosyltransferase family 2 protein n=1 Tax=Micrococcales TaxID=85006 RepID=UPI00066037FA|nr:MULTISPECIES: glycosyltransferase family 2 protein [Micrococcales]
MRRPSEKTRLLIVIPAWNEEAVLGDVLEAVKAEKPSFADILVVSDGSVDATASIARAAGVAVLDLPLNLGVGGAMRAGFQYARRSGYQYACQLDADGQHDPGEIETLIDTASREGADVVIGSRFAGKGNYEARGPRKWAMNLFSFILSRVCHTRLSDTTSGFKLYGPRALSLFARNYPAEYLGDTIGALVIAARSHLVVREVGVQMHPRAGGEPSHNPIKSALFLVRATLALVVSLSRPGEEIATASEVEA